MYEGALVFAQVMSYLPVKTFRKFVDHFGGDRYTKSFSCQDQYRCMAFAQLTYRESLRDVEICLRSQKNKLYHIGIRGRVSRSTLADANEKRDWRIYEALGQSLIREARRLYSHPVDKTSGIFCDQTIVLTGPKTSQLYPSKLRRIKYYDAQTTKTFVFLTNHFGLPAETIVDLYRHRWQVDLFFKWIKQHLRIKSFFGTSENAVKTQIWIAVSVYVLIAIIKKRLKIEASLYTILQVLSLSAFEKVHLIQLLTDADYTSEGHADSKQLNLFD
ncbi:MAG: DUF4372 domain-containing protein [Thermoanaerobaculales bacterium]|nr:DUF4372 domain-containing protein [Thermoanaerobaculales bacterium]